MIQVNDQPAEAGCYIDGNRGQYAINHLAQVCEQFQIVVDEGDTPEFWQRAAEADDNPDRQVIVANTSGQRLGSHIARPDECWDRQVEAGDQLEQVLNHVTVGGFWHWDDGEFYLVEGEPEC